MKITSWRKDNEPEQAPQPGAAMTARERLRGVFGRADSAAAAGGDLSSVSDGAHSSMEDGEPDNMVELSASEQARQRLSSIIARRPGRSAAADGSMAAPGALHDEVHTAETSAAEQHESRDALFQEQAQDDSVTRGEVAVAQEQGSEHSKLQQATYPVVVYTADELRRAQEEGAERIVVKGELARKLQTAFKGLRSIGAGSLNTLALCLSGAALLAPFTGGVSLGTAGTAMGTLGAALTATAIAAISAIGFALVIAVFKGYDEVRLGGGGVELVIKKGRDRKSDEQPQK